ncbi:type IX secretion system membrane protein PorP/SprF [Bacteroidota bacterium]
MNKSISVIFVFFITIIPGYTQQQATFSQYMFNGLAINPAYAGSHEVLSATALVRYQSLGLPGAPTTQSFSAHTPLLNEKIALGALFVHDKIGVIDQTGIYGSYAYRIQFSEDKAKPNVLSLGLQAGVSIYDAKYSELQIYNSSDPAFARDITQSKVNFGFGIYYYTHKLYAGLSIPHLSSNVFDRGDNFETITQTNPILLNGGYVFKLTRFIKFKPNFLMKFVDTAPVEIDLNGNLSFDDVLWVGVSYKALSAVNVLTEAQVTNQIRIGYAYSLTTSSLRQVDHGSHEFLVNYRFKYPKDGVLSPRHF